MIFFIQDVPKLVIFLSIALPITSIQPYLAKSFRESIFQLRFSSLDTIQHFRCI